MNDDTETPTPAPVPASTAPDAATASDAGPVPATSGRRRNPWRAFVLCVVAVSVAGAAGIVWHRAAGSPDAGSPTGLLRLPHTLLDRSYTLAEDDSAARDHALTSRSGPGIQDMHIRSGFYDSDGDSHDDDLEIIAFQGRIADPAASRARFADSITDDSVDVFLRRPRGILPAGSGEPLTCAVIGSTARPDHKAPRPVPVCLWADHETVGIVYDQYQSDIPLSSVDLTAYAADVARVRAAVRVKAS